MFDFLKRFQKQPEQVSETTEPVIPKEPKKSAEDIFLENNPITKDYKLTYGDLSRIKDFLMYNRRVCGIENQVGYVHGVLVSLIMKIDVTLDNQKLEL